MDDTLRHVFAIFSDEAKEQTESLAAAILAMEQDASCIPERIEAFYRDAHSIKGSAGSLGLTDIATLAHQLESAFMGVRGGGEALQPSHVDAALRATEAILTRCRGIIEGSDIGTAEIDDAIAALGPLIPAGEGDASHAATAAVTVTEAVTEAAGEVPKRDGGGGVESSGAAGAATAVDGDQRFTSVRVTVAHLEALDKRLGELRALHRLALENVSSTSTLLRDAQAVWRALRDGQRAHGAAHGATGQDQALQSSVDVIFRTVRGLSSLRRDLATRAEITQVITGDFDYNLRSMRLVPASLLQQPILQTVRGASRETGKQIRLQMLGGETEIDRRLLERLKAPLLHLVRNAVDHGIEPPEVRRAIGKPVAGTLTVAINQRAEVIEFEIKDDGRGIDVGAICRKAVEQRIFDEGEVSSLSLAEKYDIMFRPGFSTAEAVTQLSGRGVGLDVVRETVMSLNGRVTVASDHGKGATFSLIVPLTLASSETMCFEEGSNLLALPLGSVEQVLRVPESDVRFVDGRYFVELENGLVGMVRLARLLGMAESYDGRPHRSVLVVRSGGRRVALACDRLAGLQELVFLPLPTELRKIKCLDGVAVTLSGQAVFVLSPRFLVDSLIPKSDAAVGTASPRPMRTVPSILVADDTVTMRALLRSALGAAGFDVRTAADGEEALRLLSTESFDLVLSDVRMPKMDGFALTARLRANPRTAVLPVVLYSNLDSEEDRQRGRASGATAYLSKAAVDRGHLTDVITELLRESGKGNVG